MEISEMVKAVVDTNVLVRSLDAKKGASFKVVERFKQNHFILYMNANLMTEYDNKLNQLFKEGLLKDALAISQLLNNVRNNAVFLRIPINMPIRSTDYKDNCLLEVALVGGLDYIVTNDAKHLLPLSGSKSLDNTKIVLPSLFIRELNLFLKS